jgi:hypothetical protein
MDETRDPDKFPLLQLPLDILDIILSMVFREQYDTIFDVLLTCKALRRAALPVSMSA